VYCTISAAGKRCKTSPSSWSDFGAGASPRYANPSADRHHGPMIFPLPAASYLRAVAAESSQFGAAARRASLSTPVPSCPGWDVEQLIRHVGTLHRWVASLVSDEAGGGAERGSFDPGGMEATALYSWLAGGRAELLQALRAAGTDRPARTLLGPGRSGFWFRRMAHETAIHRLDLQNAADGRSSGLAAAFAADGIDEFWAVQLNRKLARRPVPELAGTLRLRATDVDAGWLVRLDGRSATAQRLDGPAAEMAEPEVTVEAPAALLLLFLWNRAELPDAGVSGLSRLVERWPELVRM
jgi:uncharacterized protein (TIGR03083 family)